MGQIKKLIGKRILSIKGYPNTDKRIKKVEPSFILFDDGETYIEFIEQDYYTYHDCNISARTINIRSNKVSWNSLNNLPDANHDEFLW